MKSGLLTLAVVAIVAGVAGDVVMGSSRPFPRIETKTPPAASPSAVPEPAGRGAALETHRQPVAVLWATGGEWRARALRGATEVNLSVGASGDVSID